MLCVGKRSIALLLLMQNRLKKKDEAVRLRESDCIHGAHETDNEGWQGAMQMPDEWKEVTGCGLQVQVEINALSGSRWPSTTIVLAREGLPL